MSLITKFRCKIFLDTWKCILPSAISQMNISHLTLSMNLVQSITVIQRIRKHVHGLRSPGPEILEVSRPHPPKWRNILNPLLYQPQHWTSYFCILPSSYLWRINKQNWIFLMSFTLLRLKLEKLASRCLPLSVPIIDYQQFSTVTVTAFPYRRTI